MFEAYSKPYWFPVCHAMAKTDMDISRHTFSIHKCTKGAHTNMYIYGHLIWQLFSSVYFYF